MKALFNGGFEALNGGSLCRAAFKLLFQPLKVDFADVV
jgi:hypothetical protein